MLTTEAECRINGVHVAEVKIEVSVENGAISMSATYATLETLSDKIGNPARLAYTHGRCTAHPSNWSKETADLLSEMLKSMERDLLPRHFKLSEKSEGIENATKRLASSGHEEADQV